ncbi:MAG: hypothetical protein M0Q44_21945 [Methylobacter sp.]|jgi:hypothetical protein|nr:hypothetical protein [Methylobacter sp.]
MLFGLACEGVTDQITIENILCGYFKNPDLDEEITQLQPPFDETDKKQKDFGGWQMLLAYLSTTRFRDDVLNNNFIVIQVDTDVSNETGFDVSQVDANNQPLIPEVLITNVIAKLVVTIDSGDADFYQQHSDKIIFCVSVHSLECWLYAYHNKKPLSKPKITGCYKALSHLLPTTEKTYRCYDELSRVFLNRKNIDAVVEKDPSFYVFIQSLEKIEDQIFNRNNIG